MPPAARYVSTRGDAGEASFEDVLLNGLAPDGGLYVPTRWPHWSDTELAGLAGQPYADVAAALLAPFTAPLIDRDTLARLTRDAYASFDHRAVTPLVQLDERLFLLELFHGPTLAFKDVALQLLGRLFDHVLTARGLHRTVIGATSGDTGSAAIEACRDRESIDIFILHPHGRPSEVQRRQMTTVLSPNVHNLAIDGTFDDCQDLVKALFADPSLRAELGLSAVNSINWARIMAQAVYYVTAALALGAGHGRKVAFAVPTGNFGNVYAATVAHHLGLPLQKLIIGTNANDILHRFFETGIMQTAPVTATLSPSMDIQISSNFERLLFDLLDRDSAKVAETMRVFRSSGRFAVSAEQQGRATALFASARCDDAETLATTGQIRAETGMTLDPHTATGVHAARQTQASLPPDTAMVALACAHAAKFPDAVERATGQRPALPERLADLFEREERQVVLPNDYQKVRAHIARHSRAGQAA